MGLEQNDKAENPLVSIIVITYNSSKYVLETLESAKAQTYHNIELIISDDYSTDNTVELSEKWIKTNKSRFVRTELVKSDKNTGIAPNCNRGLKKAKGEWVKFIAGDDMLMHNCIAKNMKYARDSEHSFFFSKMKFTEEKLKLKELFDKGFVLFNKEEDQLKIILKNNYLAAPTSFIRTEVLKKLKGFDERFPMLEDYPLWLKAVQNNHKIIINNLETVIYRIDNESVSQSGNSIEKIKFYRNIPFRKSWNNFSRKVLIKEQFVNKMPIKSFEGLVSVMQFKIVELFNNKKNILSVFLYKLLFICKPSFYYNLLIRKNNDIK